VITPLRNARRLALDAQIAPITQWEKLEGQPGVSRLLMTYLMLFTKVEGPRLYITLRGLKTAGQVH
jgi:hypothetical protein